MIYDKTYNASLDQNLESVTCNTCRNMVGVVRETSKDVTSFFSDYLRFLKCIIFPILLNLGTKFSHIGKSSIS